MSHFQDVTNYVTAGFKDVASPRLELFGFPPVGSEDGAHAKHNEETGDNVAWH